EDSVTCCRRRPRCSASPTSASDSPKPYRGAVSMVVIPFSTASRMACRALWRSHPALSRAPAPMVRVPRVIRLQVRSLLVRVVVSIAAPVGWSVDQVDFDFQWQSDGTAALLRAAQTLAPGLFVHFY